VTNKLIPVSKKRVPLHGKAGVSSFIDIDPNATNGAQFGKNIFDENGNLITLSGLLGQSVQAVENQQSNTVIQVDIADVINLQDELDNKQPLNNNLTAISALLDQGLLFRNFDGRYELKPLPADIKFYIQNQLTSTLTKGTMVRLNGDDPALLNIGSGASIDLTPNVICLTDIGPEGADFGMNRGIATFSFATPFASKTLYCNSVGQFTNTPSATGQTVGTILSGWLSGPPYDYSIYVDLKAYQPSSGGGGSSNSYDPGGW
jgi:hypothetical protein